MVLVGNKVDLIDKRVVSAEQGMQVSLIGFEADPTGVHPTSLCGTLHCALYPLILHQKNLVNKWKNIKSQDTSSV